jgi:hypothetical protein
MVGHDRALSGYSALSYKRRISPFPAFLHRSLPAIELHLAA